MSSHCYKGFIYINPGKLYKNASFYRWENWYRKAYSQSLCSYIPPHIAMSAVEEQRRCINSLMNILQEEKIYKQQNLNSIFHSIKHQGIFSSSDWLYRDPSLLNNYKRLFPWIKKVVLRKRIFPWIKKVVIISQRWNNLTDPPN